MILGLNIRLVRCTIFIGSNKGQEVKTVIVSPFWATFS